MHIAVAGNIGSGKTTLTTKLAEFYGWEPHFESVDDNPYLDDFYKNMLRWSFNLQVYFLNSRLKQVLDIRRGGKDVIQDRTIYEDAEIFAPNLHEMGLMASRDYENYAQLFQLMSSLVQPPDLLIYLRASVPTLKQQIQSRGRAYEAGIRDEYLSRLNERYEAWIGKYARGPMVILDVDSFDLNRPESFSMVAQRVDLEIRRIAPQRP